jgi:membrane protein
VVVLARTPAYEGPPAGARIMHSKWKQTWVFTRDMLRDFYDDDPFQLAAATSYYTLLSLAPLLLIVVTVAGLAFEREAVTGQIVTEMRGLVGEEGAKAIETVVLNSTGPKSGISLAIGIFTLLIGASTVFQQLQTALNKIWDVKADPKKSKWTAFLRRRLATVAMVFAIGFLLLVSLVLSAALSAMTNWLHGPEEQIAFLWQLVHEATSLGVIGLLLAMMFKFLPDRKIAWRHVWFGAFLTALLSPAARS